MYQPIFKVYLSLLVTLAYSRQTRYANLNIVRPDIKRKTEGGRTFMTACQA